LQIAQANSPAGPNRDNRLDFYCGDFGALRSRLGLRLRGGVLKPAFVGRRLFASISLTLFHERRFSGACKRLSVLSNCFAFTGGSSAALVAAFAFFDEGGFGRSRQRLTILINRSCFAAR
jgi:hypothetical protein